MLGFKAEAIEIVQSGIRNNNLDNAALELNALKLAYDTTMINCDLHTNMILILTSFLGGVVVLHSLLDHSKSESRESLLNSSQKVISSTKDVKTH